MRLIDADALCGPLMAFDSKVLDIVDNAPTIDAVPMDDYMDLQNHFVDWEPIRHGKWVVAGDTTHYYICSVCGEPGDGFDNYCRSCGAKMEGAEE